MDTPTHALIPVIVYGIMRQEQLTSGTVREKIAVVRTALIVGLVGALPDMADPHVTLAERLESWSHCMAAWVGFSALLGLFSVARKRWLGPFFAIGLSLTYFSHIVGDAIAGGVGWSYPFSDSVIGDYYVIPEWWIPADFICFAIAYICYRVMPKFRAARRGRRVTAEKRARVLEEAGLPPTT